MVKEDFCIYYPKFFSAFHLGHPVTGLLCLSSEVSQLARGPGWWNLAAEQASLCLPCKPKLIPKLRLIIPDQR